MSDELQTNQSALDDERLGHLVHDVVEGWAMPPVRLDQPSWRDRVHGARGRSRFGAVLRPLGRAVSLAVAVLVGVIVLGVLLNTRAPSGPAAPGSSVSQSAGASQTPGASLHVTGALPSVTKALVDLQDGSYAVVDVASDKLGAAFVKADFGSAVRTAADGSLYCVCVTYSNLQAQRPTHATVTLRRFTADGDELSTTPIGEFDGAPDPRDGKYGVPEQPDHVRVDVSFGSDSSYAYVGWSAREHPVWKSGVIVVDISSGQKVGSLDLPDATDGAGDTRRMTDAPRVVGQAGDQLIIGRSYYEWAPANSAYPSYDPGTEAFSATLSGAVPGNAVAITAGSSCGDVIDRAGASDAGTWLVCSSGSNTVLIRRSANDGTLLGQTSVSTLAEVDGSTYALSRDGASLYVWHPVTLTLTRVDLATGDESSLEAPKTAVSTDVLSALGQWLVPAVRAKMLLSAGLALAPDGSHLYALGVDGPSSRDPSGSVGIFDFTLGDTMTVERWEPTADFVSVAVSADGDWVYAAGTPGVDASGGSTGQSASVTVYDAHTGAVARIADGLGSLLLTFPEQVLR